MSVLMPENRTNLLGQLIRQFCERYGLSRKELAKLVGLSLSTISRIEGNRLAPSKQTIVYFKIIIVVYIMLMNSTVALAKFEMTLGEDDVCWPAGAEVFCEHADLPLLQCLTVVNANKMVDACIRSKTIINKSVIDECLIIMRHRSDNLLNILQEFGLNSVNECRNYFDDPMLILGCTRVMICTDSENFR